MPYKDEEKAKEAARERQRKHRSHPVTPTQNVTPVVTPTPVTPSPDVTPKSKNVTPYDARTFGYATRDVPKPKWLA